MLFDQAIDIPAELSSDNVTIALVDERIRYSLRIKAEDLAEFKKITGLKLPKQINQQSSTQKRNCLCLGPDEWLVIALPSEAAQLAEKLAQASDKMICSVTNISHRNVGFDIQGQGAEALINVGCPQDLSIDKFPIGKATRTVFESASVVLFRTGETSFHLECWRSFGPYMRDFFKRVITT